VSWNIAAKTVVVTGATNGIGLAASIELARRGANVVLVGRDERRLQAGLEAARAVATGDAQVRSLWCDFSSQAAIRAFAKQALATLPRIDVLINNAGLVSDKRRLSADGIELTFATNHLGYFLTTNLLLDRIVASAPARVVTVSSIGHWRGTLDFDDLGFERGYSIMKAYRRSKLCNILFANELARRLEGKQVTSTSCHPGGVRTNIWEKAPAWTRPILRYLVTPFFLTPEQGAERLLQLAAEPLLEGVTGKYFEDFRPISPAKIAEDEVIGRRLWTLSESLVGLARPD
jgi:retinol dehydrogenase-14